MPTYLCHGFRWQRRSIRVYIVVQDLDDAAPEWIVRRGSARCLLESFYDLFDFLPQCAIPPPISSSRGSSSALRSHLRSLSRSIDNALVDNDDDARSYSSTGRRSRSRSRSQSRSVQQQPQQLHDQRERDRDRDRDRSTHHHKESSNSSKKRSKSETRRRPAPNAIHNTYKQHHQSHQAPPSPPASQPPVAPSLADDSDEVHAQDWSPVKLVEEYDPHNLDEVSRPYAYVTDYVRRIDSSCSIIDEIARYEERVRSSRGRPPVTGPSSDEALNGSRDGNAGAGSRGRGGDTTKLGNRAGWFEQLRDQLQRGEEIRWYVVVNGDEERAWPDERVGGGPETTMAERDRRRESLAQMTHHAQYAHQQLIYEAQDRDRELEREKLRRELGYERGGIDRLVQRAQRKPPAPPEKDLPMLKTKISMDQSLRPKTPKTGGFRRLFGRPRAESETP